MIAFLGNLQATSAVIRSSPKNFLSKNNFKWYCSSSGVNGLGARYSGIGEIRNFSIYSSNILLIISLCGWKTLSKWAQKTSAFSISVLHQVLSSLYSLTVSWNLLKKSYKKLNLYVCMKIWYKNWLIWTKNQILDLVYSRSRQNWLVKWLPVLIIITPLCIKALTVPHSWINKINKF